MTDKEQLLRFYNDLKKKSGIPSWKKLGLRNYIKSELKESTSVTHLFLEDFGLKAVPDSIAELNNLIYLDLKHNSLRDLPDSLTELKNLTFLDLQYNKFSIFPKVLPEVTNLVSLYLGGNQLTVIPESIGNMTNLKTLDLCSNEIHSLPESISNLSKLYSLMVVDNQLTTLPKSFGKISKKATLPIPWIKSRSLNSWSEDLYFRFEFYENKIDTLPNSMKYLPDNGELHLDNNNLEDIPDWIFHVKYCVHLYNNPGFDKFVKMGWKEPDSCPHEEGKIFNNPF